MEGLKVNITISVDYRLGTKSTKRELLDELLNIYNTFGNKWQNIITIISRQTSNDIIGKYKSKEIISSRNVISLQIFQELSSRLSYRGFRLTNLYILQINFSKEYDNSLILPELVSLKNKEEKFLIEGIHYQSKTNISLAEMEKSIIQNSLNTNLDILNSLHLNKIKRERKLIEKIFSNFYEIKIKFGIADQSNQSAASELLLYYWIKLMQNKGISNNKMKLYLPENLK